MVQFANLLENWVDISYGTTPSGHFANEFLTTCLFWCVPTSSASNCPRNIVISPTCWKSAVCKNMNNLCLLKISYVAYVRPSIEGLVTCLSRNSSWISCCWAKQTLRVNAALNSATLRQCLWGPPPSIIIYMSCSSVPKVWMTTQLPILNFDWLDWRCTCVFIPFYQRYFSCLATANTKIEQTNMPNKFSCFVVYHTSTISHKFRCGRCVIVSDLTLSVYLSLLPHALWHM